MKRILLTALLIVTANTVVAATVLSPKHNKKLPTAYELITKGEILHEYINNQGDQSYYILWDKTDDLYSCRLRFNSASCILMVQGTLGPGDPE